NGAASNAPKNPKPDEVKGPQDVTEEVKAGAGGAGEAGEQVLVAPAESFNMTIRWGSEKEEYQNVSLSKAKGTRTVAEVLKQSKIVDANPLSTPSSAMAIELRPKNALYDKPHYSFTERIADGKAFSGSLSERTGIFGLEEVTDATMIVCPDLMSAYMRTDKTEEDRLVLAGLQKDLLTHCALMKDRFAILDAPPDLDVEGVREYRMKTANFDSDTGKYGALYYPWIHINNPAPTNGDRILMIPPSGHLAGIYARVDADRGVHKAPANEAVRGALKLERRLIDGEQAILNPVGVNCIREFPGRGILVWGARTLAEESSEWRYINVRRLFNFVEESIYEGTQWVVFEPNDMDLWERVKRTINAFLTRVWQSGALFGATAEQAFYVKCDAELNTPAVRDAGQLIVEIGIA
ncbi:MAG TPA: phage tail sheath subtilisin-like domain-containing protein, partial [Roseiflexaceae bacterium]|nr:phage tail sheath subtilisin-like domain-containing protein [Roseiflexaceae bacterium]